MFSLKTVFKRMIETSTKCTWWTVLFKLGSISMRIILMILTIVMASVIASSGSMWSMKITTMATATSALIIAVVIIVIATTRRIKLPVDALKLAFLNYFVGPFPFAGTLYMASYYYSGPYRVYSLYYYLYNSHCGSSYFLLHTLHLVHGGGEVVEVVVVVSLCLCFSFLHNL